MDRQTDERQRDKGLLIEAQNADTKGREPGRTGPSLTTVRLLLGCVAFALSV